MDSTGFLQAIVADPESDDLRLAFADWLEEHSTVDADIARVEFIRGQIELARTSDSPARRKLALTCRNLLKRHRKAWLGPLAKHARDVFFRRGFPDRAMVAGRTLARNARALFARAPWTRLRVVNLEGNVAPLAAIPEKNTLASLDLCYNALTTEGLQRLCEFPALARLKSLGVIFNQIDDRAATLLVEHPFFQQLSMLACGANPITPAVRDALHIHFGTRITFECERDDDHLYALQDDYGFGAGFGRGDVQLLIRATSTSHRLAIFDYEGNLLEIRERDVTVPADATRTDVYAAWAEAKIAWMKELGYRSATIRIKRFHFENGEGIYGFNWWREAFDDPNHEQPDVRDRVGRWLADGQFEWRYGAVGEDNCWIDGRGEVTDT